MKCVIKTYSKETNLHTNTFMLCGTGAGNFDNHDTYQWVSYPWGTIYPEVQKYYLGSRKNYLRKQYYMI